MSKKNKNHLGAELVRRVEGVKNKQATVISSALKRAYPKHSGYVVFVDVPAKAQEKGTVATSSSVYVSGNAETMLNALVSLEIAIQDKFGMPIEKVRALIAKASK